MDLQIGDKVKIVGKNWFAGRTGIILFKYDNESFPFEIKFDGYDVDEETIPFSSRELEKISD